MQEWNQPNNQPSPFTPDQPVSDQAFQPQFLQPHSQEPQFGQSKFAPKTQTLSCKGCGAALSIKALGRSLSIVCDSCGSILDITDPSLPQIISNLNEAPDTISPLIALGTRGKLRGYQWEVIGFLEKKEVSSGFIWYEYLLFNPLQGYRWLSESQGHWNYILMTKELPTFESGFYEHARAIFLNKEYKLFNKGTAIVSFALGEFYWRVRVEDETATEEYIHPPYLLSGETHENEAVWSLGEYIEPREIEEGFQLDYPLPEKHGIAPNQPSNQKDESSLFFQAWALCMFVTLITQFMYSIILRPKLLYKNTHSFAPKQERVQRNTYNNRFTNRIWDAPTPRYNEGSNQETNNDPVEIRTPSFEIPGRKANLDLVFKANNLNNSWFAAEGELVNESDGSVISFNKELEKYSGYDSDGSWSEGSDLGLYSIQQVPSGKYHMNLEVTASPEVEKVFSLSVVQGSTIWSNFGISVVLLLIPLFIFIFKGYKFEESRWQNSDYSPYNQEED